MRITAGFLKGRRIRTLKGDIYRPATSRIREAIFSILSSQGIKWEDTSVIDFFAGSGSLGLEALSRGAKEVWFVDVDRRAVQVMKKNLMDFKISEEKYRLICCNVFSFLNKKISKKFQLIFIDPPYRKGLLEKFLSKLLDSSIMDEGCFIFAEVERELNLRYERLILLKNKTYGQTRLCLWTPTAQK